jgi:hypothetical protein
VEWVSSVPEGEVPSVTPFDRPETLYPTESRALELRAEAEEHARNAAQANQTSDNYILLSEVRARPLADDRSDAGSCRCLHRLWNPSVRLAFGEAHWTWVLREC